jgi:hypothetical protein
MHILWYRNPLLEQYLDKVAPYAVLVSLYFLKHYVTFPLDFNFRLETAPISFQAFPVFSVQTASAHQQLGETAVQCSLHVL